MIRLSLADYRINPGVLKARPHAFSCPKIPNLMIVQGAVGKEAHGSAWVELREIGQIIVGFDTILLFHALKTM
ncbi:MAG: hypothetical protein KKF30_00840 [Proteobacteria bacterium]|nr:hypothetical protein [Pseudomonadota bacterium]MBU4471657.1 hypothetical protein [Pseudomonadota bacterium]MCG2751138.1 hypothetical protein [Desulfobacteraceae bacterium]